MSDAYSENARMGLETDKVQAMQKLETTLRGAQEGEAIHIPDCLTPRDVDRVEQKLKQEKQYCQFCAREVDHPNGCKCATKQKEAARIRKFDTGAIRDSDEGKLQYFKFFSPIVLKRLAEYLHEHRKLPDGSLREPDNWQQGIAIDVYMDSMFRHFMDLWMINRGYGPIQDVKYKHEICADEALCAILFNAMGYLFELLKPKEPKYFQPYFQPAEAVTEEYPPYPDPYDGLEFAEAGRSE